MLNGDYSYYGRLSLKGKPMNYRKNSTKKIADNKVFNLLKQAIGLTNDGKDQKLNYYNIVIAADADDDGIHICSLLLNMFDLYWP